MYGCIVIAAAMERELGYLRPALDPPDALKLKIASGTIAGKTVYLLRTGIGPAKTRRRLAELEGKCRPDCIISIGCAGALEPSLGIGEAILADKLIDDSDGGREWFSSPPLVELARTCCEKMGMKCKTGSTVSTDAVAATGQDKETLAKKYGALAVDMESAQIACWAASLRIPMLSVRTISDLAGDTLPPEVSGMFDRDGNLRIFPSLALFARNPSVFYRLYRLKSNFSKSIDVLAGIMQTFLVTL